MQIVLEVRLYSLAVALFHPGLTDRCVVVFPNEVRPQLASARLAFGDRTSQGLGLRLPNAPLLTSAKKSAHMQRYNEMGEGTGCNRRKRNSP